MIIKKSVWETLGGFPEDLRACEDLVFFSRLEAGSLAVRCSPDAMVRWQIPNDLFAVVRQFKLYSLHTLKAGLGRTWHRAITRMYLVMVACLAVSLLVHWSIAILPALGLIARAYKSISEKRHFLPLSHGVGPHTIFLVAVILLWIDLGAFVGAGDYLLHRAWRRSRAAKSVSNVAVKDART